MTRGLWSFVLGAAVVLGCGSSSRDVTDGDSDERGDSGASSDSGEGGRVAGRAGALGLGGRAGAGTGGVNECPIERCGGEVVGSWEIVESCVGETMEVPSCPGATGDASGLSETGSITYNDDTTYVVSTFRSGILRLTFPLACVAPGDCDQLELALESSATGGLVGASCEAEEEACACDVAIERRSDERGTYAVLGDALLMKSDAGGVPVEAGYCVEGDRLTLSSANSQSRVLERR